MGMNGELVKKLREYSQYVSLGDGVPFGVKKIMNDAASTIEALSEKLAAANMERPAEDCGDKRIYCGDGKNLPEDGVDVLVWYEYFRYGEYNRLFQTTGISFTHNGKWSGFVNGQSGWNQLRIIAWQPGPESYNEP